MSAKKKKLEVEKRSFIIIFSIILLFFAVFMYGGFSKSKFLNEKVEKVLAVPVVTVETIQKEEVATSELLGRMELSFAGSNAGRSKNIELGVARIDGTVVEPGKEFSFAKALGPVNESDGFSKEKTFLNGEVTRGIGGGLCQVSTTLFQSAVRAGFPITERHNHTHTVSYYDVGLDATFAEPGPDVRFVNDTEHPITIKGSVKDKKVAFEIYGVSDGRQASTTEAEITNVTDFLPTKYVYVTEREKGEPECVNTPQIGYTAKVIYNILYPTGLIKEQTFISTYAPLQRVCTVVTS